MTPIQLSLLLKDKTITQIYTGLESGCRCGCHGKYFNPGEKGFTRALNKAKDLDPIVDLYRDDSFADVNIALDKQIKHQYDGITTAVASEIVESNSWIDICTGNGKTITICYE